MPSVDTPVWLTLSGISCIECSGVFSTHSAEVRLAVSGERPLFIRGLSMFVLSPQ